MKKKRYIISSYNTNKYFHRQGTNTSFPARNDQVPIKRNSSMEQLNGYSQISTFDDTQAFNVGREYQYSGAYSTTVNLGAALSNNHNKNNNNNESTINDIHNWEQLLGDKSEIDTSYLDSTQTDLLANQSASFGFQQQPPDQTESLVKEINFTTDYQTFVRSQKLYFDPNPELIRKPQMITPLIYKQNIMIKFLKPPSVPLGPLIIREVRPPQPPPPPPLVSPKLISFFIKLYFKIDYPSTSSTSSFTTTYYSS